MPFAPSRVLAPRKWPVSSSVSMSSLIFNSGMTARQTAGRFTDSQVKGLTTHQWGACWGGIFTSVRHTRPCNAFFRPFIQGAHKLSRFFLTKYWHTRNPAIGNLEAHLHVHVGPQGICGGFLEALSLRQRWQKAHKAPSWDWLEAWETWK